MGAPIGFIQSFMHFGQRTFSFRMARKIWKAILVPGQSLAKADFGKGMMRSRQPCLPTMPMKAPAGEHWVHEPKIDGFRINYAHRFPFGR
jgi:hypothetical protein